MPWVAVRGGAVMAGTVYVDPFAAWNRPKVGAALRLHTMVFAPCENRAMHVIDELADWAAKAVAAENVRLVPLPAEASTRQFFRVVCTPATPGVAADPARSATIAMHSPPATEDTARFIRLAERLRSHGLTTPAIYAVDLARGFVLMEDLGDTDFAAAYANGHIEAPLEAAIRALAVLQTMPVGDIPPYTEERFVDELSIFAEWLVERFLGLSLPAHFDATRRTLVAATQSVPRCVVHRDYHCRNLIWRADGTVGIVDFQDALVGPACYDIASLLRDCYVAFDEADVARWRRRFFDLARPDCDAPTFERAFDLTAIQRQLKAAGIFARLYLSRERRSHLGDIVPVLGRIAKLARRYPETTELAAWLGDDVVPAAARRMNDLP